MNFQPPEEDAPRDEDQLMQAALSNPALQGVVEVAGTHDAYEMLDALQGAYLHWGGWSGTTNILGKLKSAITAIITERDEWKERYLQVTAQTARAEDRVEALHASIVTLRSEVEALHNGSNYGPWLRNKVLAWIDAAIAAAKDTP